VAVAHIPGASPDQVVAQSPPANAQGVASPKINLLITAPQKPATLLMPNFTGHRQEEAAKAIADAGLRLGMVNGVPNTGLPPGTIVKQSPAAGQKITPDTTISFDVAR